MDAQTRQVQIGSITAWVISDHESELAEDRVTGLFAQDAERMVAALRTSPYPRRTSRNILYVETDGQNVLIDTGMGHFSTPTPGALMDELMELGIAPEVIDAVILTHFHMDHFGGLLTAAGEPAFPNARLITGTREYDHAMSEENLASMDATRVSALKRVVESYRENLELVEDDREVIHGREVVPGMSLMPIPGHTPGQNAVLIQSDGETLLHAADAIHFPIQLNNPDAVLGFDRQPQIAVETRRTLIERAAREGWQIVAYHFPLGVGRIIREGNQYLWQAL